MAHNVIYVKYQQLTQISANTEVRLKSNEWLWGNDKHSYWRTNAFQWRNYRKCPAFLPGNYHVWKQVTKFNSGASAAVKVAKALGVSVDDILGDNQNKSVAIEASEQNNKKPGRTTFAVSMIEKTKLEILATKLEDRVGCKVRWTDILHRMIDDIDLEKAFDIFSEYVDSSKK